MGKQIELPGPLALLPSSLARADQREETSWAGTAVPHTNTPCGDRLCKGYKAPVHQPLFILWSLVFVYCYHSPFPVPPKLFFQILVLVFYK